MQYYHLFGQHALDTTLNNLRSALLTVGGDPKWVDVLVQLNLIADYEHLYHCLIKLLPGMRQDITDIRFLLCLSGEAKAFHYAVHHLKLNATTINAWQESALHYASLSGQPKQIDLAINLGIAWDSESYNRLNILHYAILSKNPAQIDHVLSLEKHYQQPLNLITKKGRNILHFAALTGDPETLEKVITLAIARGLDFKSEDIYGFNALNYAIYSNNQRVVTILKNLGLKASNQEHFSIGELEERKLIMRYSPGT